VTVDGDGEGADAAVTRRFRSTSRRCSGYGKEHLDV
jgi:hypothetical protein